MADSNKPRGKYRQYSSADLVEAVDMVHGGLLSIRKASREYNIPRGTLQDKLNGRSMLGARSGPSPVITVEEEERLVTWCLHMCSVGYGRTRGEFLDTIQKIIVTDGRPNPFKNGRPGKDWYYQFLKRHPEVVERQSHDLGKERALVNSFKVNAWFDDFQKYMSGEFDGLNILKDPSRIYNADESGFPLCAKLGKVMAPLGAKTVYQMTSSTKTQITVLASCSASAHYIPPLIVYLGSRFNYNPLEGFKEAVMGRSENGWMDSELFFVWISTTFHQSLTERQVKRPVLLLVDGHSTHINLQTSEFCRENGIILYCLLEHASHIMQPLDLCLFSSLKSNWTQAVRDFQMEHVGESVSKVTFASVFKQAWMKSANVRNAIQGFLESGLFPLDPAKVVNSSKLAPGSVFSHTAHDDPVSTVPVSNAALTPVSTASVPDIDITPLHSAAIPVSTAPTPMSTIPVPVDTALTPVCTAAVPASVSSSVPFVYIPNGHAPSPTLPVSNTANGQESSVTNPTPSVSAFDVFLKLPSVEIKHKAKGQKRVLPKALSGDEMYKFLKTKQEKKEQEAKEKEQRKIDREIKRQEREQEKARKKAEREEIKKKREEEKKKRASEKMRSRKEKELIMAESDSDDGEVVFDDESDDCEEHEACKVCGEGGPEENSLWIGCDWCEGWMHRACCREVNFESMTEEEIEDIDFVCNLCKTIVQ